MNASELAHALDRLAHTGRVLYVAAHPDDENTRLLSYFVHGRHAEAAYLSLTRGGGGQNLIGGELGSLLDVIRTEELLAARRIDGARQFFSRMRDFGYSKSARETLEIWGHEEALADVVWVIRRFQPDLIVARFNEEPPNHGHHTASAILAREAFTAAADPKRFPEQLGAGVTPWQARRLVYNLSTWRNEPIPPEALPVDVGGYDVRRGLGYAEIAALSRSQHKSQGFGASGQRGEVWEHFTHVAGEPAKEDLLEGVDLSWRRYGPGGAAVQEALDEARRRLERDHPERALPALVRAHRALDGLPDSVRIRDARDSLEALMAGASALFLRATAPRPALTPGATETLRLEVLQRRPAEVRLRAFRFPGREREELGQTLALGKKTLIEREARVDAAARPSTPHWLAEPPGEGRHVIREQALVAAPLGPPALAVEVELELEGLPLRLQVPVVHTRTDRVHGERIRSVLVHPPATVSPLRDAVLLPEGKQQTVSFLVRAARDGVAGELSLPLPKGWRVEPERAPVQLERAGDEAIVHLRVSAPPGAEAIELHPLLQVEGAAWSYREDRIDYPHIPPLAVLQPATLRLVPVQLRLGGGVVGYLPGAGDSVAEDLAHVGVRVEILDEETLRSGDLQKYAAIVLGVRAYNTRQALRAGHERLMRYVEQGGRVLVQYNTTSTWAPLELPIGPYALQLGDGRVTDQRAAMRFLDEAHPLLQRPNRITAADFEGWVQERGLYFARSWDARYEPLFLCSDPGEEEQSGSTLVARHGKGRYVYTGLSFFRQLRAGVPGAYRLFINLISGEDET